MPITPTAANPIATTFGPPAAFNKPPTAASATKPAPTNFAVCSMSFALPPNALKRATLRVPNHQRNKTQWMDGAQFAPT